jgi:hypothetical protein
MPKLLRGPRLRASAPSRPPAARMDDGLLVTIRGLDQWIALPGDSPANPALLVVTGPGAAFSPMAPVFTPWEADFTLVHWDQPNAGATYARGGWTGPFTLDRLAADGIAVAEWVRARLGVPLALFCVSGGTAVGLMMVRARPELFAAYVGNGQIVDRARQETASYAAVLADARAAGDATAAALEAIGPPPWSDLASEVVKSSYANVLTPAERAAFAALPPGAMGPPPAGAAYVPHGLPVQDARAQASTSGLVVWRSSAACRSTIRPSHGAPAGRRRPPHHQPRGRSLGGGASCALGHLRPHPRRRPHVHLPRGPAGGAAGPVCATALPEGLIFQGRQRAGALPTARSGVDPLDAEVAEHARSSRSR